MYATSDLHFYHTKVLEFCKATRPWDNIDDMHQALIDEWNKKATKNGVKMFSLGDFSFGLEGETEEIVSQLKGDITFITGNHDRSYTRKVLERYGEVTPYKEVKYCKKLFCMMHYPILDWKNRAKGSIHLFGHQHGGLGAREEDLGKAMDVGWDAVGKIIHFDEILEIMENRSIHKIGHH